MKKLLLLALALGSLAAACTPGPTTININGDGGSAGNGDTAGSAGSGDTAGSAGSSGSSGSSGSAGQAGTMDAGPSARDYYIQQLHPNIVDTCGGCHTAKGDIGPGWMDIDPIASYELSKGFMGLVVDPASDSVIINKPPHEGPALSDTQKPLVLEWIGMELKETGGGTGSTGSNTMTPTGSTPTVKSLLDSFAKCMDIDLWTSSGMDKFPYQQTNDGGACYSCHSNGAGGTWLDTDVTGTFEANKTFPYIMRLVTPIYDGNTPKDLAASLRFEQKGTEKCVSANQDLCHPKFALTPDNQAALEKFQSQTLQKWHNGPCP